MKQVKRFLRNPGRAPTKTPIASACTLLLLTAPSYAQETDRSDAATLDTIVVTAQRTAQDIRQVPLAVTVVEPDTLRDISASARDILSLGNRAPSVQAESSFGRTFPRFYIRGLGNSDFDLNASQPVSMVVDDVVMENPVLKGSPIFDMQRVEVLRGPQGALFGRNTPAGVIQFVSNRPSDTPEASLSLSYGTFDTIDAQAVAGGPAGDHSSWRMAALHQRRSSISANSVIPDDRREGFEESAVRAQWQTRIGDSMEALLQVRYRNLDGGSAVYRANAFIPGTNRTVPGLDRERLDQDAIPTLDVETRGISFHLNGELYGLRWESITAWDSVDMFARGDVDGGFGASFAPPSGPGPIPFPAESGDGVSDHRQITQEFRVYSDTSAPTQWLAGAFLFDEDLRIDNFSYDTLAGSALNGYARQHQKNRSYALFGHVSHAFPSDLTLATGLRYTHDDKRFVAERLITPFGGAALPPQRRNPSDGNVSGDVSLTWRPSDRLSLYGRIATGYRAPAVQGRVLFGDTVSVADSERIVSAEFGLRTDLFDGRARASLTAYRYELDQAQLTAVGGSTNFNTLINADNVVGQGAEAEFEAKIGPSLSWILGGSYNETRIDDPNLSVAPCAAACTVLDPVGVVAGTVSIDGNPLVQAPRWIGYTRLDWNRTAGSGELFASVDASYRSEVNFFLYRSVEFTGKPLTELGGRIGYRFDGGRQEISVFGRNLNDQIRAVGGVDFNNLTGFFNEPRVVGVNWTWRL